MHAFRPLILSLAILIQLPSAHALTPAEESACLQRAALKREAFIAAAVKGYSRYVTRALDKRRQRIVTGWGKANEQQRRSEFSAAWREFGSTWRTANRHLQDLRSKAWRNFRGDIVKCKSNAVDEEMGGFGRDSEF